jgi:hypothetical protein
MVLESRVDGDFDGFCGDLKNRLASGINVALKSFFLRVKSVV